MKMIIAAFLLALAEMPASAQINTLNITSDSILTYSETISVAGITKNDLFIRAREWLNNNCNVLKIQDKEAGEISGNCSTESEITFHFLGAHNAITSFSFDICIWTKDGQYKYVINNIENTKVNHTSANGVFGKLYISKHCNVKGIMLSQSKLDEAYQSAKEGFEKNKNELVKRLKIIMETTLNTDF